MRTDSRGFTLIELLIVISIVAILSTMAIPSYQDRVIRAQVAQAITLAEVVKKEVQDYYNIKGQLPRNNAQAGLPNADKVVSNFVKSVTVKEGVITIVLGNRINKNADNKVLTLRPAIVKDSPIVPVSWICGFASVPKGMTVIGDNDTSLLSRHVPVDCRY